MNNQKIFRKGNVKNKDSGITLIALVVTIIVLLILAGISIAMLTGRNGILSRAGEAKYVNEIGQFDEQTKLEALSTRTSITNNNVSKTGYIATNNANFTELANNVAEGLGVTAVPISSTQTATINTEGYTVGYYLAPEGNDTTDGNGYIVIWYTNNSLRSSIDREEVTSKYGITDIATEKSVNQAVLVRVIHVENYTSELSEMGLTSTTDGNADLKRTENNTTKVGTGSSGQQAQVQNSALYIPDLNLVVPWEDLVKLGTLIRETEPWETVNLEASDEEIEALNLSVDYKHAYVKVNSQGELTKFWWQPSEGSEIKGTLVIPDNITSIGDWAFKGCENLTNMTIPNSVTRIGMEAFSGCATAFTSLVIPDSVESIGQLAFNGCTSLSSLTISNGDIHYEYEAFHRCTGLVNVSLPLSYVKYGVSSSGNFSTSWKDQFGDSALTDDLTDLNYDTYYGSVNVVITGGSEIKDEAFKDCYGLTSITIPNSVTSIGNQAFYNCESLTSIIIPSSVTSIGYSAFEGCRGLTSITIPNIENSVGDLGLDFSNISTINFGGTQAKWLSDFNYENLDDWKNSYVFNGSINFGG